MVINIADEAEQRHNRNICIALIENFIRIVRNQYAGLKAETREITDILPDDQKLIIETAKVIREGFLQQNAFHATDTYMKPADQMSMLRVILRLYDGAKDLVAQNIPLRQLVDTGVFTALERMKFELGGGKPAAEFMELVDNAVASVRRANA